MEGASALFEVMGAEASRMASWEQRERHARARDRHAADRLAADRERDYARKAEQREKRYQQQKAEAETR